MTPGDNKAEDRADALQILQEQAELLLPLLNILENRRATGALDRDLEWSAEFDRRNA